MPRPGGKSEKLGNRYEVIWTVDSILDLIIGDALSITVEPFAEESLGIEFIKRLSNDVRQHHSVKRQTTGSMWSVCDLTKIALSGRSILGDLFEKLSRGNDVSVFVSSTTANDLNELCERVRQSQSILAFETDLSTSSRLQSAYLKNILPLCSGDTYIAYEKLRRLEIVGITESELIHRVNQRIRLMFYRPDGHDIDPLEVRHVIGELLYNWFGQALIKSVIITHLLKHGYAERDWVRDPTIRENIQTRNATYLKQVELELICGAHISRNEANKAFDLLINGNKRYIGIVGPAGFGKSCVVAQTVHQLQRAGIATLAVRMDIQTSVLTSHKLGLELNLPVSPPIALAGIANGNKSVLILDQLDAISCASGRNQNLWMVFEEMLREVECYPNMRVLLACRAFDADNDSRLRGIFADLDNTNRINLETLTSDMVREILGTIGINFKNFETKQIDILRIPLHLSLYLQTNPKAKPTFYSVDELLDRYWHEKQRRVSVRLGRSSNWLPILYKLTTWLSDHQTLSAPLDVLDEFHADMEAMRSEYVLVVDGKTCRFFHETFFDYAFARIFVSTESDVLELLTRSDSEQHLFRRAQVRQILSYQRGRDFNAYLEIILKLLTEPNVRFHIKKMILEWLRNIPDPKPEEWRHIQSINSSRQIIRAITWVPFNSIPWFDVLQQYGTFSEWLNSDDDVKINHVFRLFNLSSIMEQRSEQIVDLLIPFLQKSEKWNKRLLNLFYFGEIHCSRKLFDFFIKLLESGITDGQERFWYHSFYKLPRESPELASELLGRCFDRVCIKTQEGNPLEFFKKQFALKPSFVHQVEDRNHKCFISEMFPRIVREIKARPLKNNCTGLPRDALWPMLWLAPEDHDFSAALLFSMQRSLCRFAVEQPDAFAVMTDGLEVIQNQTIAFFLLSAWSANPSCFGENLIRFFAKDSRHLILGYAAVMGEGQISCAISRDAIKKCAPLLSDQNYFQLEFLIQALPNIYKESNPKWIGYQKYLLLESLPRERMSEKTISEYEQLNRKFSHIDISLPKARGVYHIESPISSEAMTKMTDEHWLKAMTKYNSNRREFNTGEQLKKGGLYELATALAAEAQKDKQRFAALIFKMTDNISEEYFGAILRGVTDNVSNNNIKNAEHTQTIDSALLEKVIIRVHNLPNHPCGRDISWAIQRCAGWRFTDAIFAILSHYAIHDSDPDKEMWQIFPNGNTPYYNGDPYSAGINSVRGSAAEAIANLLFADRSCWPKVSNIVLALINDPSKAVKSVVAKCLLAVMNINRDLAVELFLKLSSNSDEILSTYPIECFLNAAVLTHYSSVRRVLLQMLHLQDSEMNEVAARQIAVAAFEDDAAKNDLKVVLDHGDNCRAAVAAVYAGNLRNDAIREICRTNLKILFHDKSKEVRQKASDCFRMLGGEELFGETSLIEAFIMSPAFEDGSEDLVMAIEQSTYLLPDVVCSVVEKILQRISLAKESELGSKWEDHELPKLILRVYNQSNSNLIKTKCLNLLDKMLELEVGNIEKEIESVER